MDTLDRLESALDAAVAAVEDDTCPPRLAAAVRHAVFPGGARLRPRLCLAVAEACGAVDDELALAGAAAIELLHCASLVHDDLPCFDDAPVRRGKPSVHSAFGEQLAVLVGDALIVMAFDALTEASNLGTPAGRAVMRTISRAVGVSGGIVAGQAWECERDVDLSLYHRLKTGALFVAATTIGPLCAGQAPQPWRIVGDRLGEAYQIADDLSDKLSSAGAIGKPVGRDQALGRPNAVGRLGIAESVRRLETLLSEAAEAIPPGRSDAALRGLILAQGRRLSMGGLDQRAA
jgi:geranylgeranyl diphosphate synthase type II